MPPKRNPSKRQPQKRAPRLRATTRDEKLSIAEETGQGIAPPGQRSVTIAALPEALRATATDVLASGDVTSGVTNIAILQALLVDEARKLEDDRPLWLQVQAVMDRARARGWSSVPIESLQKIVSLGYSVHARVQSIRSLARDIARLRRDEVEIIKGMRDILTPTDVAEFRRAVVSIINEEITDASTRERIARRMAAAAAKRS